MGTARCLNCGHTFTVRVVEDSPDINYFEYDPVDCPECLANKKVSDNTEFVEYHDDDY